MKRFSIALVLMILSVTACSGPAALGAQANPEPATPVVKTAPPTGTPVPEPTVTPAPDIVGTVVAAGQPQVIESHLSPDGQWLAEIVAYECVQVGETNEGSMVEQLTLTRASNGEQTTVDRQQISCSAGLGAYGLSGWFWSPDSRYFYYTDAREGVPDGGGGFCWDRPLIRLDVTDGSVNRLAGIWVVSSGGTTVAMRQENDLVLWDLDQGEIARTSVFVPQAKVCEIAWSPDGQALAYLQTPCPFCGPGKFYLVHFSLQELEHTSLLELEEHSFITLEWETADQIKLSGYKDGEEWVLDLPIELNVQLTCLAVPQVSIEMCYPNNYALSQNPEESRRGSFVSYDFLPMDGYQTPYLSEMQFFSENSIDEFTRDCGQSTPCFFGDYPDLDRYYGQREALKTLENYQDFVA